MSTQRIEETEKRLAEVEALQQTLEELQRELGTYRDLLTQRLTQLQNSGNNIPTSDSGPRPRLTATGEEQERRASPRRRGNPVSVYVTDPERTGAEFQGWIVDRSSGGVRLLMDQSVLPGTVLNIRPMKCHPSFPWIAVEVKSCRPERNSWNLSCQFVEKLSWSELQLFG
jgi:hypothetical protein